MTALIILLALILLGTIAATRLAGANGDGAPSNPDWGESTLVSAGSFADELETTVVQGPPWEDESAAEKLGRTGQ